jgi:hypothetical protein
MKRILLFVLAQSITLLFDPEQSTASQLPDGIPLTERENREIPKLVDAFLTAIQSGKTISLERYCTPFLQDWYGHKNISREQAEEDLVQGRTLFPLQRIDFNIADAQYTSRANNTILKYYVARIPIQWTLSDGKITKSDKKLTVMMIVQKDAEFRIEAVHDLPVDH